MKADKEGFELLDIKGVDRKVQHLFSEVLREDELGRLWANYYGGNGDIVDHEVISLSKLKFSSCGILHFSPASPLSARTLYISDSVANLISFAQSYDSRFSWDYAVFIATGAKLERSLFMETVGKYPQIKKHYTIFDHSLIGRIRDCKVQDWLNGEDCFFTVVGEDVVANYHGEVFMLPVREFSLRNHLRKLRIRQTLTTYTLRYRRLGNEIAY